MTDHELYGRARNLAERVRAVKYPSLVPKVAQEAIKEAATLIEILATREVRRCQEQPTAEKQ
jgi:hypothetical protein